MSQSTRVSRRRFVAAGAALAAAPMFVPSTAFGANEKIQLATIGSGGMGRGNTGVFLKNDAVRVVAMCDVDQGMLKQGVDLVNARYESTDCAAYADHRELLARNDIDAVCIATPDHWHGILAVEAIEAGKDIYCQKPITHTFAEGLAICDAVKKHNTIFQVGSQQRSTFNFRWAVELVLNGHIGRVRHVQVGLPDGRVEPPAPNPQDPPAGVDYERWCGPAEKLPFDPSRYHFNWRWHMAYGAGQLMDWIGHHNDIAHWGLGRDNSGPVKVRALGFEYPKDRTVWNAAHNYEVFSEYDDGVTVSISNKHAMGCRWIGEDGWVHVSRGSLGASDPKMTRGNFDRGPIKAYESRQQEGNFIDCVKSREQCICPAETGHRSITPGHLGLVSEALGGRILHFDPAKQQVVNDSEAQALLAFNPRSPWGA